MRINLAVAVAVAVFVPASPALAGTTTGADIQVSGSSNLGSPVQGQEYVYTYQVKNAGPQDASPVTFTDDLAAGTLVAAQVGGDPSQCSSTGDGSGGTAITCTMSIAKGGQANVTLDVDAPTTFTGSFSNTGSATSSLTDPNPSNNSSTVTVKVGAETQTTTTTTATYCGTVRPFISGILGYYGDSGLQWGMTFNNCGNVKTIYDATVTDVTNPNTSCNYTFGSVGSKSISPGSSQTLTGFIATAPNFGAPDNCPMNTSETLTVSVMAQPNIPLGTYTWVIDPATGATLSFG
jgi:uncharacterized repeat protein (TIGR01451 family)